MTSELDGKIAIVGMSVRFPGADNLFSYYNNLKQGTSSIRKFSEDELLQSGISPEVIRNKNYLPYSGYLEDHDCFDYELFGMSARDARVLDPQQRLFLECCWRAIENAGYPPMHLPGTIGVFAGSSDSEYLYKYLLNNTAIREKYSDFELEISNSKDQLALRASYYLNFTGPSITIQTACSTSLAAIHLSCLSLLAGESTAVLAGGVSLPFLGKHGYFYQPGGNLSRSGRLSAFDEQADGIVPGFGCGVVLLKMLEDAINEGDQIHAVISGSAITNDGRNKANYTAPSIDGQIRAVDMALNLADNDANDISFIEMHGSGTYLGDPMEVAALNSALSNYTNKKNFIAISSVKANIGHLDAAAGVAGFIKAALQLKNMFIFPAANYQKPNESINFTDSAFYIPISAVTINNTKPIGCINSLGIGGTNCFVILEKYIKIKRKKKLSKQPFLITFSAYKSEGIVEQFKKLLDFIIAYPKVNIVDIVYTMQRRTEKMPISVNIKVNNKLHLKKILLKKIDSQDIHESESQIHEYQECIEGEIIDLPGYEFTKSSFLMKSISSHRLESSINQSSERYDQILKQIWFETLEIESFDHHVSLFDLGAHSLTTIMLIEKIKQYFNISLPHYWPMQFSTFHEQLNSLKTYLRKPSSNVIKFNTNTNMAAPTLILFHASASGAEAYQDLYRFIDPAIRYACVDSLNLNASELVESLEELVGIYVEDIINEAFGNKLFLAGWSLGGILALEAARRLRKKGINIPVVFMIDTIYYSKESEIFFKGNNYKYFRHDYQNDVIYQNFTVELPNKLVQLSHVETKMVTDYLYTLYDGHIINFIANKPLSTDDLMDDTLMTSFNKLKQYNGWPSHIPNYTSKVLAEADHQSIIKNENAKQIAHFISQTILEKEF